MYHSYGPFALTGNLSVDIPTSAKTRSFGDVDPTTGIRDVDVDRNAVALETNFALEYSLIYLQDNVKNVGLVRHLQPHDPAGGGGRHDPAEPWPRRTNHRYD